MEYLTLAAGAYLTGFGFFVSTGNVQSALMFRVIPGLIGVGLIIAGASRAGLLPVPA